MSMGKLHHAMMGTAAVAIGTAAAIPGTVVNRAAGGGVRSTVCFGHPSGTLRVGAEANQLDGQWQVTKAIHEPQRAGPDGRLGQGARADPRLGLDQELRRWAAPAAGNAATPRRPLAPRQLSSVR